MKTERFDVYATVTDRIIEQLEKGIVPWQSPSIARVGWPRNFQTKRGYNGINVFLLGSMQYQTPYFLTFIQAKELGGHVRKGEHGLPVIKWGQYEKKNKPGELAAGDEKTAYYLRMYTVFNACQVEGIEFPAIKTCDTFNQTAATDRARDIIAGMKNAPPINEGNFAKPHYKPGDDIIELPSRNTFRSEYEFYNTLFHELAHSTGHGSRLNRPGITESHEFGDNAYSQEELVAEMTAAFLSAHAGIVTDYQNTAAYLANWLQVLKVKENKRWIIKAAADAQKACNHILGTVPEVEQTTTNEQ